MGPPFAAVDAFRDASASPDQWPLALDQIARSFNSDGATMIMPPVSTASVVVSTDCQPYVDEYCRVMTDNPRERRVNPTRQQLFMPDSAYFTHREIERDAFYQDYLKPRGFYWNATALVNDGLIVSLKRAWERGPYLESELRAMNDALPWLRAASKCAQLTWRANFRGQLSAFEHERIAAIVLDRRGAIVEHNACFTPGDPLDTSNGRIRAAHPGEIRRLETYLHKLLGNATAPPPSITLRRQSGGVPVVLTGLPSAHALRSFHSRAAALILIRDPARSRIPDPHWLSEAFGLTPKECGLCVALSSGSSLREAAKQLLITESHARQRLKTIFAKTNTHRQSDLIALLGRLA